ncbi:MAG: nucleoside recognition domain-containing protein [Lachnospiraceae bacterium]|nr:nucleoside recognition domain-containing protein [Lachnospiraceae bacterium]MDO5550889.1 nucleoside recognition domain-containing protein [Lachnospiraceae bacterium]
MLNYLWSGMILIGIVWAAFHGRLDAVTMGALDGAADAVSLGITMLGVLSFWSGIMEIGQKSGLVDWLAEKMEPVLHFLFPRLEPEHPAMRYMAVNMIANMLGLGAAATPAGLKAMEELAEREAVNCKGWQRIASNEMCTFLIINISSLQLVPVNIIAYRSQYGSSDPAAIVGPALAATVISTVVGVVFCKGMDRRRRRV